MTVIKKWKITCWWGCREIRTSYIAVGYIKQFNCCGKQFGSSSKCLIESS
jgi:hypothetical protein